jgi:AcrR family transcriptional regulator
VADPARTLALLWRRAGTESPPDAASAAGPAPPRRGRKPGLTVDAVVDAAVALADAEGKEALTMRRVAHELGVVPMTLYTYAPGKAELLDLMLDKVYLAMDRTDTAGRPWRERVAAIAAENRELFTRHPWAAGMSWTRPPLGPGQMAKYEHELRAFDDCGLTDVDRDAALTFLLAFVRSVAQAEADARAAAAQESDEQWWQAHGPLLDAYVDVAAYPTAARVGAAAGEAMQAAFSPDRAYEFGLARVLDGLGVLIGQ